VRLLQRCKHPDTNPIPARRDRIHCNRNYCTALLVSAFSSSRKGIFVSTDAVPHLALKLNIINGVRSGHLNGQEDHSPPRRISVQDFTNVAKEMHHLIGKFGQDLLKF